MQTGLAMAALLMGLAGGPHCVAMCGAASAAVIRIVPLPASGRAAGGMALPAQAAFHLGRIASYAAAGAMAAASVDSLAQAGTQVAALRPLWMLLHVFVFAWGAVLAVAGRQPVWAQRIGRTLEGRLRPLAGSSPLGMLATGALWVAMPCGLLYSALLVASLSGGALEGAFSMALFAIGSSISLGLAPSALRKLQALGNKARKDWGTRIAGGLLALTAAWALWMDLADRISEWCNLG